MLCTVVIMSLHYVLVVMDACVIANQFVVFIILRKNMDLLVLNVPIKIDQTKKNLNDKKKKCEVQSIQNGGKRNSNVGLKEFDF